MTHPGAHRRRRPGGPDRGLELARAGVPRRGARGRVAVGGIARTEIYRGYRFDIGGHRFFTKVAEVEQLWEELLGDDFIRVPPPVAHLLPGPLLRLPAAAAQCRCAISACVEARASRRATCARGSQPVRPGRDASSTGCQPVRRAALPHLLQDLHREGLGHALLGDPRRLGGAAHPGPVAQRAPSRTRLPRRADDPVADRRVPLPALGPGQMWERVARRSITPRRTVDAAQPRRADLQHDGGARRPQRRGGDGRARDARGRPTSSAACRCRTCAQELEPAPPAAMLAAASRLRYRDFLIVGLIVNRPELFPDNWIYVHAPDVKVGRIQNFKNWSPEMVPDPARPASAWSTSARTTTTCGSEDDAALDRAGARRARAARAWRRPTTVDGRVRDPPAQGLPGLRRRLPRCRSHGCAAVSVAASRTCRRSAATACTATTTRTTRC